MHQKCDHLEQQMAQQLIGTTDRLETLDDRVRLQKQLSRIAVLTFEQRFSAVVGLPQLSVLTMPVQLQRAEEDVRDIKEVLKAALTPGLFQDEA
jgi:hypothetical protein